ncbi:hypothetical protein ABEB36_011389 [Hypothenemus hampei]|uniref:Uncharacterized protein n=1 Tax=Hypothenemus hampei TaxID=57062 RepID=A0ABD1EF92_HYPHA
MTSLARNKKGTVIHRITSETLRLGDEIIATQVRVTTRKKSQVTSPSCSFQITGVMTRYDQEDESADDLDESHTDEISRVTDNETPSFSEDSRDDQNPALTVCCQNNLPKPVEEPEIKEEPKELKANINNNNIELGRFRVVKLRNMAPFSRGRWTCYDYVDESSANCQSTFLYTGSIILPENSPLDSNRNEQTLANVFNTQREISEYPGTNSVSCTATIDTKIEHALDVVKNHLTHAVRLEVEELKIKINELVERISFLEYENVLLRSSVAPEVLASLENKGH